MRSLDQSELLLAFLSLAILPEIGVFGPCDTDMDFLALLARDRSSFGIIRTGHDGVSR